MTQRGWALVFALGFIWGLPYVLIHIAVQDLHPVIVAFGRTALGALILLPLAARAQAIGPAFRHWKWLVPYTILEISLPWFLIGYAETRLPSSTAGLIVALTPLIAAVVAGAVDREPLGLRRAVGLLIGLMGVAALLGLDLQGGDLFAIAALLLSAAGYAIGPIIIARRLSDIRPIGVVAASLVAAALIYLPAVPFYWPSSLPIAAIGSIATLAVLCTAVAFLLLFALVAEAGPARATLVAYLNPAVAVALGVIVLDEPLTPGLGIAFTLILLGCYLAAGVRKPVAAPKQDHGHPRKGVIQA